MKKFDIFKTIQLIIFVFADRYCPVHHIYRSRALPAHCLKSAYPGAVYLIMGSVRHLFPLYFP